jgi:hypothetical protein
MAPIDRIDRERFRGGGVPHKFAAVVLVLGTAVLTYTTRLHPLWIFAVAPLLGWSA